MTVLLTFEVPTLLLLLLRARDLLYETIAIGNGSATLFTNDDEDFGCIFYSQSEHRTKLRAVFWL